MKDIAEQGVIDIGDMDVEAFNDFCRVNAGFTFASTKCMLTAPGAIMQKALLLLLSFLT